MEQEEVALQGWCVAMVAAWQRLCLAALCAVIGAKEEGDLQDGGTPGGA